MVQNQKKLIHVVSFSAGRSSAYLVYLMERARREFGWIVHYVFCDTGVEAPATYAFLRNCIKHWDLYDRITILRADVNPVLGEGNSYKIFQPEDLMNTVKMPPFEPFMSMMQKYGTPHIGGPYCSERMKKDVFDAYCKDRFGKKNYVTWLGIRADEPARLKPKPGIKYLGDLVDHDKQDIIEWWSHQDFDLDLDEWEGNCLFCIKKSTAKIALAAKQNPGFLNMWKYKLKDQSIREKDGHDKLIMYYGNISLDGIATMYADHSEDEIRSRMRVQKRTESGSCSESCEAVKHTGDEINFDVVHTEVYKQFEEELELNQFEFDLVA